MFFDVGGEGLVSVLDVQSLFLNWICAMTREHAKPNSILFTRNLPFDSDVRQ